MNPNRFAQFTTSSTSPWVTNSATTSNDWLIANSTSGTTLTVSDNSIIVQDFKKSHYALDADFDGLLKLLGGAGTILMPDKTKIIMDDNGNYKICDKDAKVVYEANFLREFNKYVNASELLRDFVRDLGRIGVTQDKVLKTPIEFFINWLIHKAAEADRDPYASEGVPTLEQSRPLLPAPQLRCNYCQRYLSKKHDELRMYYCNPDHMHKYAEKCGLSFGN